MSSPLCRLTLLSICLLLSFSSLFAQLNRGGASYLPVRHDHVETGFPTVQDSRYETGFRPVQLDIYVDLSMPMDPDVRVPFHWGGGLGMGVRIALTDNQKVWLTPMLSVKTFGKNVGKDGDHTIRENLDMPRVGAQLEYEILDMHRCSILVFGRADYNWVSNYFSEDYDYNYLTGTSTTIKSKDFLKGNGLSCSLGLKWQFAKWYLKANYEYMKTSMRVNKDIVTEAQQAGYNMPAYHRFDFSNVNIGGGFAINFKRRRTWQ